jgi:citrate synthase
VTVYLSASEAAARLGVSRQTLYAYVSRGLLRAHEAEDPRARRYDAEAVERLAGERRRGRRPKEVAKAALHWGTPVLESAITLIRDGRLWYRGVDALALARTAEVEDVAALLWAMPREAAFGPVAPVVEAMTGPGAPEDVLTRFAVLAREDETAGWVTDPGRLAAGSGGLVRLLLASVIGRRVDESPIHLQCARAWWLDEAGATLVRQALILSADHELNASGFTVRCIASTGASLRAAVIGGLAALSGPAHGGMTARVEGLWDRLEKRDMTGSLRRHLASGEDLPGFGHPLYPEGDPRAAALLAPVLASSPEAAAFVEAAERLTGRRPSLDLALVAVRRHLGLPPGSAFKLFALGRSLGWIAQALEQRASKQLIRPRAVYTGPEPAVAAGFRAQDRRSAGGGSSLSAETGR